MVFMYQLFRDNNFVKQSNLYRCTFQHGSSIERPGKKILETIMDFLCPHLAQAGNANEGYTASEK